jgi:hypothetical protein
MRLSFCGKTQTKRLTKLVLIKEITKREKRNLFNVIRRNQYCSNKKRCTVS